MNNFAKVIIPGIALDRLFDYAVPPELRDSIQAGQLVKVNFGHRDIQVVVAELLPKSKIPKAKNIISIISTQPAVSGPMLILTRWIADHYFCSWGEAIEPCLTRPVKKQVKTKIAVAKEPEQKNIELPGLLSGEQNRILEQLKTLLRDPNNKPVLLWGGLASERIRMYLELVEDLLKNQQQVMIIVPQIENLALWQQHFGSRYPGRVVTLHSGLSDGEKYQSGERIKAGEAAVILGTRMALFYQCKNLGLMIMEDEQDTAYKSDQKPMYHTRAVVGKKAELEKIPLILSTSAPSVETYHKAITDDYNFLKIGNLFDREAVKIQVQELPKRIQKDTLVYFSQSFIQAIELRLKKQEHAAFFVNMRGYSTYVYCRMCKFVMKCPDCDVALTMSAEKNKLYCRYCSHTQTQTTECPSCHTQHLRTIGIGTETVTAALQDIFPQARIKRIDSQTYGQSKNLKEVDIIVGTQLLNKYDYFPKTTLLGVLLIDLLLNLPDFRAAEHTFQNLIGLVQRLDSSKGDREVIIQAENVDHYLIESIRNQDWASFYRHELEFRKQLKYPPFGSLVQVEVRGADKEKVEKAALELAEKFRKSTIKVYGPAPSFRAKLRGQYRQHIMLKSASHNALIKVLQKVKPNKRTAAITISTDVDPMDVL
ncbi:MAG: primosomal protein N' [bacterium]|nr:primosomal protein N' [bacterium]MDD5353980.1 primosomal protein N' [bacterium]MDD5756047.1 primosomal protein N' [bacterium]